MYTASIRWRLPFSYAGIAFLTAAVLGSVLVLTLQNFYTRQERDYLSNSIQLMGPGISKYLESNPSSPDLALYVENLSFLIQARIRLLDSEDRVIADSGSLQAQQFIYTNLTPSGMSAEVLREGKADRYFFHIGINIVGDMPMAGDSPINPIFLPQLPTENTLCGFGLGYGDTKSLRHTEQAVSYTLTSGTGQPLGQIIISEGLAFGGKIIDSVTHAWARASLIAVLVAVGVGWWFSRRMVSPLTNLTQATQEMASGQLSARTNVNTKDEFGVLGRSFNAMANRVEEMVSTLRSFVADAAHELHTPITTLRVNLDLATEDPENLDEYLLPAQTQVSRMQALVDNLLDLSRIEASRGEQIRFSISDLIQDCAGKYATLAGQLGLSFDFQIPKEEIFFEGDSGQLRQALDNVLDNAMKFTPAGGGISLKLVADSQVIVIGIRDTGIGIPKDDLPNLFRRFHRGRNAVEYPGSGLGLAIVKAIIDRHQGRVDVESGDVGTKISITFPRSKGNG